MKASEMNLEQIRICSNKYAQIINLPSGLQTADRMFQGEMCVLNNAGELFKSERKRWKKEAKAKGMATIGKHKFFYYEKSNAFCREDFVSWTNKNWNTCLMRDGSERLNMPESVAMPVREDLKMWKDIRRRAMALKEPTAIFHPSSFNSIADMTRQRALYHNEMVEDIARGQYYIGSQITCSLLTSIINYRSGKYENAINSYLATAAACIRAAKWIQDTYAEKKK